MVDVSVGSRSATGSTIYEAPRKRGDITQRRLQSRQNSLPKDCSTGGADSESVGSQLTTSTLPRPSKPNKDECSVGSQSTLSTRQSISPRQQKIVHMLRTRSALRRPSLTSQPNFRPVRSFSASARPPMYPVPKNESKESSEKPSDNQKYGRRLLSANKSKNHPDSASSVEPNEPTGPSLTPLPQPSTMPVQPKKEGSTIRTIFHVRLSIGYMTGLSMEKVAKWTKNSNHSLVVGFVELASSGKYTALSQPLLPNIAGGKSRTSKILWANPKAGERASKSRRRLHFSLKLDRQRDATSNDDDDSVGSQAPYSPEVVKLLVGLKCGDERFPLGYAKFVVNGRETVEQKMDLAVQPAPGMATSTKAKRRFFGKKQERSSFTNGDHAYKLAPNAKLRVKADIKTGFPGQDGASVWASGQDDSSYVTNWTFNTGSVTQSTGLESVNQGIPMMTSTPSQSGLATSNSREHSEQIGPPSTSPPTTKQSSLQVQSNSRNSILYDTDDISAGDRHHVTQAPMQFVSLNSPTDVMSVTSGITTYEPGCEGCWFTKTCMPFLCTDGVQRVKRRPRFIPRSFSFESSQTNGMNDIQANSKSLSTASSSNESFTSEALDLQGKPVQTKNVMPAELPRPIGGPRAMVDDEVETLDVTVETYNDLIDARETLMRYATKVGVDMGDLLDGKQKVRRQQR